MERPSSVPCMSLPRPPSPYSSKLPQNTPDDVSKFSLQHIADMKKENFSLKLKIYYLETTLSKVSGAEKFDVLNENVQLKVENESISKELATNKDLLIKASSLVDSLSANQPDPRNEASLLRENSELQKLISNLEQELLKSRQDADEQSTEVEHLHAECMLLQDQLHLREQDLRERDLREQDALEQRDKDVNETLQAQLAAQEHVYQDEIEDLRRELEDVRGVMIKTHEENVSHRLALAEKEEEIRGLREDRVRDEDESEENGSEESRAGLLEALSEYASTNARLESEVATLESNNTELQNVINTLSTEREVLAEQLGQRGSLSQCVAEYRMEIEQRKRPETEHDVEALLEELHSAKEMIEELKHSLAQAKITTDISQHEAAILRGNIEETEQQNQEEKHIIKNLRQNLERLSQESADFSKENTIIQEENESLREKVQELNKEIAEAKEAARVSQAQSSNADSCKINELNEEILSLKQSLADAQEDIKYCKEDFKSLESEYEKVSEELELAEEDLRNAQQKKVVLTDALDELREQFLKFKSQVNDEKKLWKAKKNQESDEFVLVRERAASLEQEKSELVEKLEVLTTERDCALEKVRELEEENVELIEQGKELDSQLLEVKMSGMSGGGEGMRHVMRSPPSPSGGDSAYSTVPADSHSSLPKPGSRDTLEAQKSYLIQRIDELRDTKRSLEDSLLSLKDQLCSTPLPNHGDMDESTSGVKDEVIRDLKSERDSYRNQRKDLEKELHRVHELLHDLIRQLHRYHSDSGSQPIKLSLLYDDFLIDSLRGAMELVINSDRVTSNITTDNGYRVASNLVYEDGRGSRDNTTMTPRSITYSSSTQTRNPSPITQDSNIQREEELCKNCRALDIKHMNTSIIDTTRRSSPAELSTSTIKLTDFILLCANNWLDELPELMRALRDAIHSSIVDCLSVQTRVKERRATWVDREVGRLSARLDAVYRLLQHVENLSVQQPPSKILGALQHDVSMREKEMRNLNEKLIKRTRDINKLRLKVEEQDRQRMKQKIARNNMAGLNPSILCKVIDTESVLREAHKSLEKRMISKEMD